MRVLGIDPGTWKTGIAVVEFEKQKIRPLHYETLVLQKNKGTLGLAPRLKKLYDALTEVLKIYQPDVVALEDVFFGLDFSAAVRIGEARAVAMLAATHFNVDVSEYSPTHIKQAVTGNGRADKVQVQFMVKHLLKLKEKPAADAADALAVAISHCHCARAKSGLKQPEKICSAS